MEKEKALSGAAAQKRKLIRRGNAGYCQTHSIYYLGKMRINSQLKELNWQPSPIFLVLKWMIF